MRLMRSLLRGCLLMLVATAHRLRADRAAAPSRSLGVGDVVKITVYQNPDLSTEARVSEVGQINFPADRRRLGRRPDGGAARAADREDAARRRLRAASRR